MTVPRRRQILSDGPRPVTSSVSRINLFPTPMSSDDGGLIFDTVKPPSSSVSLASSSSRLSGGALASPSPTILQFSVTTESFTIFPPPTTHTPVVGTSTNSINLILDTGVPDPSTAIPYPTDTTPASGASSAQKVGLGVGLGLGIPLLLVTITLVVFCMCFWDNVAKKERRRKCRDVTQAPSKSKTPDVEANEGKQVFVPSEHDKIKVGSTSTVGKQPPEPGEDDRACQAESERDVEIAESQEKQEPAGPLGTHEIYELPTRNSNARMDPGNQGDSHSQREVSVSSSLYRWL